MWLVPAGLIVGMREHLLPPKPTSLSSTEKCSLARRCQGDINTSWSKLLMDADIADRLVVKALEKIPEAERAAKIATLGVLDFGFDPAERANLAVSSFELEKGQPGAGSPEVDERNHGTAVVGIIAAKETGLTSKLRLTAYKADPPGGRLSREGLFAGIEHACRENDVINVSIGLTDREQGFGTFRDEPWYKRANAERMPCLVFFSSGNAGVKSDVRPLPEPEERVTFVASTDSLAHEVASSSPGDVRAPGHDVWTLPGPEAKARKSALTCGEIGSRVNVTGTSFASPAVAAVAGQVVTLLKLRGALPDSAQQKFLLVKSILKASQAWATENRRPPVVNALLAVRLAMLVGRNPPVPSVRELVEMGKSKVAGFCAEAAPRCDSSTCGVLTDCVNALRERATLCGQAGPELLAHLEAMGEKELSIHLLRQLPKPLASEAVTVAAANWQSRLTTANGVNFYPEEYTSGLGLLSLFLESGIPVTAEHLSAATHSPQFIKIFLPKPQIPSQYSKEFRDTYLPKTSALFDGNTAWQYDRMTEVFAGLSSAEAAKFLESLGETKLEGSEELLRAQRASEVQLVQILASTLYQMPKENRALALARLKALGKLFAQGQMTPARYAIPVVSVLARELRLAGRN